MQDLIAVNSKNVAARFALAGFIVGAIILGWYAVRWQIGNLLATITSPADPNAAEVAAAAVNCAPSNPYTVRLLAATRNDQADTIADLEKAVRLAPNDYRWRVELARAYEQNDEFDRAEREFKRAVDVAPQYANPSWFLGNFYLRQDREADALTELK